MTPGLARCFRYMGGTPSGTGVGMHPDRAPSAIARSAGTDWPRHGSAQAAGHARRRPSRPAPVDAVSRQELGLPLATNFPGTAAR